MPRSTNVVHLEAQARETIRSEEMRAANWEHTYGGQTRSSDGYQVKHVWDPQALSAERKMWQGRGRQVSASSRLDAHSHQSVTRLRSLCNPAIRPLSVTRLYVPSVTRLYAPPPLPRPRLVRVSSLPRSATRP